MTRTRAYCEFARRAAAAAAATVAAQSGMKKHCPLRENDRVRREQSGASSRALFDLFIIHETRGAAAVAVPRTTYTHTPREQLRKEAFASPLSAVVSLFSYRRCYTPGMVAFSGLLLVSFFSLSERVLDGLIFLWSGD